MWLSKYRQEAVMKKISLNTFSAVNDRELFAKAAVYLKENPNTCLCVPPGIYDITTEKARAAQMSVMNGDLTADPQSIMFRPEYDYDIGLDLDGLTDCKIEAFGATLLIDGFMEPICIRNSKSITVSGFTVLHKRKPYSKGTVLSSTLLEDGTYRSLIEFDTDCPVTKDTPFSLRVLYYDKETDEPLLTDFKGVEFIDSHRVVSYDTSTSPITEGLEYYTCHTYHSRPAVMIENSIDTVLEDITVHNNCGMGFLGHRCENVTLRGCRVTPVDGDRMSTNTDASHFTCIKGNLNLLDCIFEYHGDDFSNIHGYYQKIHSILPDNACLVSDCTPTGIHAQVIDYPDAGDLMELTDLSTLKVLDTYTVKEAVPMYEGKWQVKIVLDRSLPENAVGLTLMNVTRLPRVHVCGCASLDHYARSLVIKSRDVLIENCYFRNVRETAITAYAEPYWGEGASPSNVTVRDCRFENCGWARGPVSAVLVSVPVHKNAYTAVNSITVENNYISTTCPHAISFANVDSVTVKNNVCKCTGDPIVFKECINITNI